MSQLSSGLDCNVLVLNKHYMAVRIVGARRAFSLLFRQIAEVINVEDGSYANYDFGNWCELSRLKRQFEPDDHDWVATVNFHVAVPRIIRLLSYERLPKNGVKFNRRNIFARDKNHCQYCGNKFSTSELSLDHIVPRSMGGEASWENIVCACVNCNAKKGGRTPKQAGMRLITRPAKPRHNPLLHIHLGHARYKSWKQFLDHAYWSVELK
ncbi:MAG: HNH endonuclease [Phycisphaerae bacterium]|nr:HNH endonuclease [Phycisphaerae bacterium]